ncbi:hypothetical protein U9M48_007349 [Paspalum notatum var. saurae]|uniref:Phylloplanin n=1 Tax=Paspalum notatum var. saurae TaxID=547442 RepID=A0AAQ3PZW4_PASNO
MAPKNRLVLLAALLIVVVSAGQVPGGAGLGTATNTISALISGVVPCAAGSSINLAAVPKFANATVQLGCGSKVVASTTTDSNGAFVFNLPGLSKDTLISLATSGCNVVVVTPLGACDNSLAGTAGTLSAPLKLLGLDTGNGTGGIGSIIGGLVGLIGQIVGGVVGGILNLGTGAFSLV